MPPGDLRTDAELLAAIARGEAEAFDTLYSRHLNFVSAIAHRFAPADAADITHDVFIDLAKRAGRITLSSKLTTYLYPAVKNAALSRSRRKRPRALGDATPPESLAPPPAETEAFAPLFAAVESLPETHREVLLLRIVDGLSVDETALALSIAPGTVKSRLHTALAALREDPRTRAYFAD